MLQHRGNNPLPEFRRGRDSAHGCCSTDRLTDLVQAAGQHRRAPGGYRRAARWHYLANQLWAEDTSHPFPRAGTCCFPILQSTPVLWAPVQLKRSLSHLSLQGSAALGLLSRHGLGCCSSHSVSSPCRASAARAILHLPFALLLPRGPVWASAKHQLRQDLPWDCGQDPELPLAFPSAPTAQGQLADAHS